MSVIDVTDYVEAQDDSTSLRFEDEKQQANFELGVSMVIHSWEALEVAVVNQWGGPQSEEKRDWITAIVVELFDGEVVDIQLIEETILNAMADEFECNVEDDSSLPIAAKVLNTYRQCLLKNYNDIHISFANWQAKREEREKRNEQLKVEITADPNNPDSSDDEDVQEHPQDEDIPQLTELSISDIQENVLESENGPIIDDEGFELVQKKGKRRN